MGVTAQLIECEVTFLSKQEGGRNSPPIQLSSGLYRPHLVVGDPRQRVAKMSKDNVLTEEYLGVVFCGGTDHPCVNESTIVTLRLIYPVYPDLIDKLKEGVTFTIREGARIVGFGKVLHWYK